MKNPAGHLRNLTALTAALVAAVLLSDCGGGGGYGGGGGDGGATIYTVGGRVDGLDASTSVTLMNNSNGDSVAVSTNGSFAFPVGLAYLAAYDVAVQTQPTGRTCIVLNGSGVVPFGNVTNVAVACTSNTSAPGVGNLVITEVMADPGGTDTPKEWFEVVNGTGGTLDLGGIVVTSGSGLFVVPAGTSIPSGSFFIFAGESNATLNGGLPFVSVNYGSALVLTNTNFSLTLKAAATTVDAVALTPMPSGASLALSQSKLTATDNDTQANWCISTTPYGTGSDKGTPGATNSDCP
jgi:hypothetical protein